MNRSAIAIGLVALAAAAWTTPLPAKERTGTDQAGWLAGTWLSEAEGRWTEERWASPRGGVMLGTSLTGRGKVATSYEYMRIAVGTDGRLTFWGSPEGKPAVPFRLTGAAPGLLTFENPAHDYPTRITYRRNGERLIATISGPDGARPMSWEYKRRP